MSSSSTSWCSLATSAVVCVAALSKGLITKKTTRAMMIATSTTITAISGPVPPLFGSGGLWRSGRVCGSRLLLGRAARDGYALRGLDGRGACGGVGAIGRGVVRLGLRRIEGNRSAQSGLATARGCLLNGCTARGAELGIICKKLAARGAIPRHCHSFRHISMQYDDYTQRPKSPSEVAVK